MCIFESLCKRQKNKIKIGINSLRLISFYDHIISTNRQVWWTACKPPQNDFHCQRLLTTRVDTPTYLFNNINVT